jgi:hypothetical protein
MYGVDMGKMDGAGWDCSSSCLFIGFALLRRVLLLSLLLISGFQFFAGLFCGIVLMKKRVQTFRYG